MKKFFTLFLFISYIFAADINIWKNSTLNKILKRGVLIVGTEPGYMPFEMKDKKGRVIGFDIDIAKHMAKEMGVKLKIVPTAWDGIIPSLLTGKFDIIMSGMTITQKRNLKVNFSIPYLEIGQTVLLRKGIKISSYKDLDDPKYTLVSKIGTTGDIAMNKLFKNAKLRTFDTEAEALQEVLNSKADAFIYDHPLNSIFYLQKGKNKLIHLDKPITYEPIGFAIQKGDPDFINWLNNFLRQIKNDGTYERMYNKWFKTNAWIKKVQ